MRALNQETVIMPGSDTRTAADQGLLMESWETYLTNKALQAGLTPQQREVFLLFFGHHQDREQISHQLGISPNACQQCLGEIYGKFNVEGRGRGKEKALQVQLARDFDTPTDRSGVAYAQRSFAEVWSGLTAYFAQAGRSFRAVDELILRGIWEGISYEDLAQASGHSVNYLKSDASRKLWALLTDVFGEKVGKKNARSVIEAHLNQMMLSVISVAEGLGTADVNWPNWLAQAHKQLRQLAEAPQTDTEESGDAIAKGRSASIAKLIQSQNLSIGQLTQLPDITLTLSTGQVPEPLIKSIYCEGFQYFHYGCLAAPDSCERYQQFALATWLLQLVIRLQPHYQNAHYTLGELYLRQSEVHPTVLEQSLAQQSLEKAIDAFHQASVYPQIRPWALNYLGYLKIKAAEYEEAERLLTEALGGMECNPTVSEFLCNPQELDRVRQSVLKNLGWAIFAQQQNRRFPEAAAKLKASLALNGNYAAAHCLLAQVQDATQQPSDAAWEKCLQLASRTRSPEENEWIDLAIDHLQTLGEP